MTKERTGELFIFGAAVFGGLLPIIAVLSYRGVPSIISLAISTFLSSIFFLAIILYKRKLHELKNLLLWKYVFFIVVFIGILGYGFYYLGLTRTTPGNAAIIGLSEIFTSYIFFNLIRKEHFSFESKVGTVFMVTGALIVLAPNFYYLNFGDFFILIANFCWPIGNLFQQKAKLISSTETILFLRSLVATPFLFLIAYAFGQHLEFAQVKESLPYLIISGFFLFGVSKIFWLEGISRISVTKANATHSLAPLVTLFFAWIILHQVPTIWQITSFLPFFFGVLLLTNNLKLKQEYAKPN